MTMPAAMTQEGEQLKRPIFGYLRVAFSVVCGIISLLLVMLWVRSYSYSDELRLSITDSRILWFDSMFGETSLSSIPLRGPAWQATIISEQIEQPGSTVGFTFRRKRGAWSLSVRHWFLVLLCFMLAAAPWLKWRFSLRTLLIAMALIALGLGIVAISN